MAEPTFGIEVRSRGKSADGIYSDYTVRLSGLPREADRSYIEYMMEGANDALEIVTDALHRRIRGVLSIAYPENEPQIDLSAFHAEIDTTTSIRQDRPKASDSAPVATQPAPKAADPVPIATQPIPLDDEVKTSSIAFGVDIPFPAEPWFHEPITETNADGNGGGQMTAINAGLTKIGHGGKGRHAACEAILRDYGPIYWREPLSDITSVRDLTKGDASVILTWLALADANAMAGLNQALRSQECII